MSETFPDKIRKAVAGLQEPSRAKDGVEVPRRYPRGITVGTLSDAKAVFFVKAARRRWRWLPLLVGVIGYPLAVILGAALGVRGDYWDGRVYVPTFFTWWPTIILILIVTGGIWALWRELWPRLRFTVTPDRITVGGKTYDRQHFGGMRVGYHIKEGQGVKLGLLDQEMGDHFLGFSGLRLQYGRWGDDLDYMVNRYHAAEYVVWMNEVIAEVGKPAPKEHDPAKGRKKAEF